MGKLAECRIFHGFHNGFLLVNGKLFIINLSLDTVNSTLYTVNCALFNLKCKIYIVHCRGYSKCTVHCTAPDV